MTCVIPPMEITNTCIKRNDHIQQEYVLLEADVCPPKNSYVEALPTGTSEYNHIWRQIFKEIIKLRGGL